MSLPEDPQEKALSRIKKCSKIPVIYVDYQSPKIKVKDAMNGTTISKKRVIEAALKRRLFPPQSTWHYITFSEKVNHISEMQKRVDLPLKELK